MEKRIRNYTGENIDVTAIGAGRDIATLNPLIEQIAASVEGV